MGKGMTREFLSHFHNRWPRQSPLLYNPFPGTSDGTGKKILSERTGLLSFDKIASPLVKSNLWSLECGTTEPYVEPVKKKSCLCRSLERISFQHVFSSNKMSPEDGAWGLRPPPPFELPHGEKGLVRFSMQSKIMASHTITEICVSHLFKP